jgi:hypothetical protein
MSCFATLSLDTLLMFGTYALVFAIGLGLGLLPRN